MRYNAVMKSARSLTTSRVPQHGIRGHKSKRQFTGKTFIIRPYEIRPKSSEMHFRYETVLRDGSTVSFVDVVTFHEATPDMWQRLPAPLLASCAQSLSIMLGINYWMPHAAPEIQIQGFSLTKAQAEFWNELYTKGLGEFFFVENIDFRGLISFPFDETASVESARLPHLSGTLLANGGGKDSVVSAELLSEHGIPFTLFEWRSRQSQQTIAKVIGAPSIMVTREWDRSLARMCLEEPYEFAFPLVSTLTFFATIAAALHGFRFIVLSNESSSDSGNVEYYGLSVNHQWSKSAEAEVLIQKYINDFISPDIIHFSLLRPFTELEATRRFSKYPYYFSLFSSCNNLFGPRRVPEKIAGQGYWCGRCAKCVFIFASLSAFLKRDVVINIVGEDLYSDSNLMPMFRRLLGLEGDKPFDCVGVSDEMIVAMHEARATGAYADTPAMELIDEALRRSGKSIDDMRRDVFSFKPSLPIPEAFAKCHEKS